MWERGHLRLAPTSYITSPCASPFIRNFCVDTRTWLLHHVINGVVHLIVGAMLKARHTRDCVKIGLEINKTKNRGINPQNTSCSIRVRNARMWSKVDLPPPKPTHPLAHDTMPPIQPSPGSQPTSNPPSYTFTSGALNMILSVTTSNRLHNTNCKPQH